MTSVLYPVLMGRLPSCECGTCQKCRHREYMRNRYQTDPEFREKVKAGARASRERRIDDVRAYDRERSRTEARRRLLVSNKNRWRTSNPEKAKAQRAVAYAVSKGYMTRQPCEVCGSTYRIHAHHDDYEKPLDVRWLCAEHHSAEHRRPF